MQKVIIKIQNAKILKTKIGNKFNLTHRVFFQKKKHFLLYILNIIKSGDDCLERFS